MALKIQKKHFVFIALYFATLLILLLDVLDNVPFTGTLRKIKYIYLFVMFIWYLLSIKNFAAKDRIFRKSNFIIIIGVLHSLIFGYIFTNDVVLSLTYIHARELLIYYLLVFLTLTYIYENKLLFSYTVATYAALVIQLLWAGVTHLSNFVNPLTYWRIFSSSLRYRFDFGFTQYGYTANYCVFALVVSLLIFECLRQENKLKNYMSPLIVMGIVDVIILCMLCSTAGRSGFLSLCIILMVYITVLMLNKMDVNIRKKYIRNILIFGIIVILLAYILGVFDAIWGDSNRGLNITANYPVFKEIGSFWTGMGYVDNSAFQTNRSNNWISAFNAKTSSLDMYYVYLFFTTGVVGCIMIGIILLYMLFKLCKNANKPLGPYVLSVYLGWLFYAYWQCNMLNYRYFANWFYLVVILYCIDIFSKNTVKDCENRIETKM